MSVRSQTRHGVDPGPAQALDEAVAYTTSHYDRMPRDNVDESEAVHRVSARDTRRR